MAEIEVHALVHLIERRIHVVFFFDLRQLSEEKAIEREESNDDRDYAHAKMIDTCAHDEK